MITLTTNISDKTKNNLIVHVQIFDTLIDDQTLVSCHILRIVRIRTDLVTQSEDKTEYW